MLRSWRREPMTRRAQPIERIGMKAVPADAPLPVSALPKPTPADVPPPARPFPAALGGLGSFEHRRIRVPDDDAAELFAYLVDVFPPAVAPSPMVWS